MIHQCSAKIILDQPPCQNGVCDFTFLKCKGIRVLDYVGEPLNSAPVVSPFPPAQERVPALPQAQGNAYPCVTWPVISSID